MRSKEYLEIIANLAANHWEFLYLLLNADTLRDWVCDHCGVKLSWQESEYVWNRCHELYDDMVNEC